LKVWKLGSWEVWVLGSLSVWKFEGSDNYLVFLRPSAARGLEGYGI